MIDEGHTQPVHHAKCQYQDINTYFTEANMLDEPEAARVPDANATGQNVSEIVLFTYKSANDEVSPINDTDALVAFYCDSGARVEYLRDELSYHAIMALTGVPDLLLWLQDLMNGVPVDDGCTTKNVSQD